MNKNLKSSDRENEIRDEILLHYNNGDDEIELRLHISNEYGPLTDDESDFVDDLIYSLFHSCDKCRYIPKDIRPCYQCPVYQGIKESEINAGWDPNP